MVKGQTKKPAAISSHRQPRVHPQKHIKLFCKRTMRSITHHPYNIRFHIMLHFLNHVLQLLKHRDIPICIRHILDLFHKNIMLVHISNLLLVCKSFTGIILIPVLLFPDLSLFIPSLLSFFPSIIYFLRLCFLHIKTIFML